MGESASTDDPYDPSKKLTHLTHDPSTHCLLMGESASTDDPYDPSKKLTHCLLMDESASTYMTHPKN